MDSQMQKIVFIQAIGQATTYYNTI